MCISEKVYRFLMRAYSRDYRERYAGPMEQLFRDSLRDSRELAKLIALWGRTLMDWAVSVPASYRPARTSPFSSYGGPARQCVLFARLEAASFTSREVTVNHLLLGVLRQHPALVPASARQSIVRAIEANETHERCAPARTGGIEFDKAAIHVITAATAIAKASGRPNVVPADLATAILRESNSLASGLLHPYLLLRD